MITVYPIDRGVRGSFDNDSLLPSNCSIKDCKYWGRDRRLGVAAMSGSGDLVWWSVVVDYG